jgi:hypothetical protein
LAERVIDMLRLEMGAPDHEVMRQSLKAVRAQDAREDSERLAECGGVGAKLRFRL